jgi:hypothetical protein
MSEQKNLPAQQGEDEGDRMIRGSLLKFVDGLWSTRDGEPIPELLLVMNITRGLQRWQDGMPVETIMQKPGITLPDVDDLNAAVPQDQWEDGLNGEKRPPWQLNCVVYLVDPRAANSFTFANSTVGARIAAVKLRERIEMMHRLRGLNVAAMVSLGKRTMKTKFGEKQRPEFVIERWVTIGGGGDKLLIDHKSDTTPALAPVDVPSVSEEMDDQIVF